jgi:hypothetical protein
VSALDPFEKLCRTVRLSWRIVNFWRFLHSAILSPCSAMRDLVALFIHIIANITRLLGPGPRAMVAESILVKRNRWPVPRSSSNRQPC